MGRCSSVPTTFSAALRWVIIHALRLGGGAARVVDREEVRLLDPGPFEGRRGARDRVLVREPAVARAALQRDEVPDAGDVAADAVDGVEIVGVHADNGGARVADDVREVPGGQAVVDGDEHRAELGNRVERLELGMRVGRDVGDPIALADPEPGEGGRPPVAPVEESLVGEAEVLVHHRLPVPVQPSRPPGELERGKRHLHLRPPSAGLETAA